ncbi:four-jointed box protein 1-like [Glandiceps talaboti]
MKFVDESKINYFDDVNRKLKAKALEKELLNTCFAASNTQPQKIHEDNTEERFLHGLQVIENGIYWAKDVMRLLPKESTSEELLASVQRLRTETIVDVSLKPPRDCEHSSCSSPSNAVVTMSDSEKAYVRYKPTCWIYGEVMTFYFSMMLCMNNVPAVSLTKPVTTPKQWGDRRVRQIVTSSLGWSSDTVMSMMKWVENSTESVVVPEILVDGIRFLHPDHPRFENISLAEIVLLIQYTDMIILDYITGNNDRLVYHLFYAFLKNDTFLLDYATHNLQLANNKLWLVDNEGSFPIGYTFFLRHTYNISNIFTDMLQSVCIFKKETVERLTWLNRIGNPARLLWEMVITHDSLADIGYPNMMCDQDTDVTIQVEWVEILEERLKDVLEWISLCQKSTYSELIQRKNSI